MKKKTDKNYNVIFCNEMNSGRTIYSEDGKIQYVPSDNERWAQCYSESDKARSQLPAYWFLSTNGNLISVFRGKAQLLKKNLVKNKYYAYAFTYKASDGEMKTKSITEHTLLRLVFGKQAYGKAEDILNSEGMDAFDNSNASGKLNCHHIDSNAQNNSLDNIELLTTDAHKVIHKAPKTSDMADQVKFMEEFQALAANEEPDKISILLTGQTLDKNNHEIISDDGSRAIFAADHLTLSGKAVRQITDMCIGTEVSSFLANKLGMDFFSTPRYLCIGDCNFYRINFTEGSLSSERVIDPAELVNKTFIICSCSEHNNLECYIPGEMITDVDSNQLDLTT